MQNVAWHYPAETSRDVTEKDVVWITTFVPFNVNGTISTNKPSYNDTSGPHPLWPREHNTYYFQKKKNKMKKVHTFPLCVSPSQMIFNPEKLAVFLNVVDIWVPFYVVES